MSYSTPPPPSSKPLEPDLDAEHDITMSADLDELEAASAVPDDVGLTTRVDEQIETRAKKSLLIPSEHPAPMGDSTPPTPDRDGSPIRARASSYAGRYEMLGLLGVGGMGSVYRVKDTFLGEDVALKILRKDLAGSRPAVERFRREVRLTRRITDCNVVRIYDIGERRGEHFYTMECILGAPLSRTIGKDRALDLDRAVDFGLQLGRGLAAVHRTDVVHRDLKPDNLMVSRDGRLVITDFGVAVSRDDPDIDVLPMRGAGTPMYMAPEQVEGRHISDRTDLYALGLILFEMLTGKLPWSMGAGADAAMARLAVPASSPRTINPDVPEDLAELVLHLLAREPQDRPNGAEAAVELLEAVAARERLSRVVPSPAEVPDAHRSWPAIATTNTPHSRSVGVLPFRNLSGAQDDYIAVALAAAITEKLVVCPTVRVAKRFDLGVVESGEAQTIGQRAGVDVVVEGTMSKRATGMVAVTVRVVEVERGFVLWANRFQRRAADLLELQSEISASLAEVLTLDDNDARPDKGPADRENVDGFLRATQAYGEWSVGGCDTAIQLLESGLERSPTDPQLLSMLALAQLRRWYVTPRAEALLAGSASSHARAALELNPNLGEAHLALAMHAYYNANWMIAARRLEEAVRCNPALSDAHQALGYMHCAADRIEQGLNMLDLALRVDPRNVAALWDSAYVVAYLKEARHAADFLDKADLVFPNHPETLLARVRIGLWLGDELLLSWAREHADALGHSAGSPIQAFAIRLFLEPEPDEDVGNLMAIAAHVETPPAGRARVMQFVAERMALAGQIDEAWSALRAASAHTVDAIWFQRCPALARMERLPAFLSLRSHVAARAAQVFEAGGSAT